MKNRGNRLQGTQYNDPEWIKKVSRYSSIIITEQNVTDEERKFKSKIK